MAPDPAVPPSGAGPRGFCVFAATPQGQLLLEGLPMEPPLALLFGSETEGVAPEILARCHGTFRVPMWGFVQSLNVSVATGVALYVVVTACRRALGQTGDLSPPSKKRFGGSAWKPDGCSPSPLAPTPPGGGGRGARGGWGAGVRL
ncbi:MAG: TrmH family RNA methyltransferase [Candidatus Bipolaricaulaceae bacterium]